MFEDAHAVGFGGVEEVVVGDVAAFEADVVSMEAAAYQIGLHNLRLWVVLPCLSAALLVPRVSCVPWSASTLASKRVACALAGLEGRITSLENGWWFFLFGVGLRLVLSLPGYFSEALAGGVLSVVCGRSFRFFARVARALATRGTARAAMLAAAFTCAAFLSLRSDSGGVDAGDSLEVFVALLA